VPHKIEYIHKSFTVQSSWGGLGGGSTANFNYSIGNIYLKLMPQFAFGSKVRFYFYPGIFFGVLVNSTLTGTLYHWQMGTPYISQTDTINGSARDYYPDFEFGIAPGIGLEIPVCHGLSLVFDYTFRMNLYPVSASWGSTKVKMFNMDFVVGCAYTFGNK
jgi:hypothetical protein